MKKILKSCKSFFKDILDKNRFLMMTKLIVLFVCLLVTISFTPIVFSKYETEVISPANSNIAFYILEENYYTETMQLADIVPSSTPYAYNFTVSNFQGINRLEVDLEYTLSIITTTNLPLEYKLYLNEDYTLETSTNIINNPAPVADSDGTYFKTMITTPTTQEFGFMTNQTNTYTLVVYFPTTYMSYQYQDIAESIAIVIESHQII